MNTPVRNLSYRSIVIAVAFLLSQPPLFAGGSSQQYDLKSGIEASVHPLVPRPLQTSAILRVKLENKSLADREVECVIGNQSVSYALPLSVKQKVVLPSGSTKFVDLCIPKGANFGYYSTLKISPRGFDSFEITPDLDYSSWSLKSSIFISTGVPRDSLQEGLDAIENKGSKHSYNDDGCKLYRENDFSGPWRADWRSYVPFDLWMIAKSDYATLPGHVKTAIKDFVSVGGRVCIFGDKDFPAELLSDSRARGPASFDSECGFLDFGKGRYIAYDPSDTSVVSTSAYHSVFNVPSKFDDSDAVSKAIFKVFGEDVELDFLSSEVPIGLFALLLISFFILAGPVSLAVLSKKNKRIHMVWIIPLIGLVFGTAVFLSIIITEGVTPSISRLAVTTIYQREKRAVTDAMVMAYSPFSLGAPLKFGIGDDVTVNLASAIGSDCEIKCGGDLEYSSNFVPPRLAQLFTIRRCGAENRRIEVSHSGEDVKIVNALGARISKLQLSDGNGGVFSAENVMPGDTVVLKRGAPSDKFSLFLNEGGNAKRTLYFAELDECPFYENPLRDVKTISQEKAAVIGYFDFQEEGGSK